MRKVDGQDTIFAGNWEGLVSFVLRGGSMTSARNRSSTSEESKLHR